MKGVVGTWLPGILDGQEHYAHIGRLRGDRVSPEVLGMTRIIGDDSLRRALQAIILLRVSTEATYDALNFRDDQFDLSDAAIAIAIALLAVASFTELPLLFWLALLPSGFSVVMGLSGLIGWGIHPESLVNLLT